MTRLILFLSSTLLATSLCDSSVFSTLRRYMPARISTFWKFSACRLLPPATRESDIREPSGLSGTGLSLPANCALTGVPSVRVMSWRARTMLVKRGFCSFSVVPSNGEADAGLLGFSTRSYWEPSRRMYCRVPTVFCLVRSLSSTTWVPVGSTACCGLVGASGC